MNQHLLVKMRQRGTPHRCVANLGNILVKSLLIKAKGVGYMINLFADAVASFAFCPVQGLIREFDHVPGR